MENTVGLSVYVCVLMCRSVLVRMPAYCICETDEQLQWRTTVFSALCEHRLATNKSELGRASNQKKGTLAFVCVSP